jgi:hypothetical protein
MSLKYTVANMICIGFSGVENKDATGIEALGSGS